MSEENVAKARAFIDAYNRRDFDAALKDFDPKVEWVLPARQSSDSCRGPEEVRRFWEGIDETFDDLQLTPQEWLDAGDRVATRFAITAKARGAASRSTRRSTTRWRPSATAGWCGSSTSPSGMRLSKQPG
jgi:ketosteroid isomerase-like protein